MRSVVLIGDSIRMGYEPIVRQELQEIAVIHASAENGRDSRNVLEHLRQWTEPHAPHVVHLNCGLHDLKRVPPATECAVPLEEYAANLRSIFESLRQTRAKIIWATNTPVDERVHDEVKGFVRMETEVQAYNERASAIAREMGLIINDLSMLAMLQKLALTDGVHFEPSGYEALGRRTAQVIAAALK